MLWPQRVVNVCQVGGDTAHGTQISPVGTWSVPPPPTLFAIQSQRDVCSRHMLVLSRVTCAPPPPPHPTPLLPTDTRWAVLLTHYALLAGFTCNVICLSLQVHPLALLGAACCPLCWWVGGFLQGLQLEMCYYSAWASHNSSGRECTIKHVRVVRRAFQSFFCFCFPHCLPGFKQRENSRGHARRPWQRKLANSASWRATVEDTLHFPHRHLHRLPHGYWAP